MAEQLCRSSKLSLLHSIYCGDTLFYITSTRTDHHRRPRAFPTGKRLVEVERVRYLGWADWWYHHGQGCDTKQCDCPHTNRCACGSPSDFPRGSLQSRDHNVTELPRRLRLLGPNSFGFIQGTITFLIATDAQRQRGAKTLTVSGGVNIVPLFLAMLSPSASPIAP